jgi:8-oxo-dGTP diphosphatase
MSQFINQREMQQIHAFNIRVYGLFININREILLADEYRFGMYMTKFPGGGLKPGEGTIDCLKREAVEEFGQEINVIRHFYTTDFYQKSKFHTDQQLISIYYLAGFSGPEKFRVTSKPFDFKEKTTEMVSFRYKKIEDINENELSFPIDKYVLNLLQKNQSTDYTSRY